MAGKLLLNNNAKGKLNANILAGDLTLTLQAGQGALFASPSGGDWFLFDLIDNSGNIEICKCTARAADVFTTIVRAQEGTVARAFSTNDKVEARWTAGSAGQYPQRTDIQKNTPRFVGTVAGTADALTGTLASDLTALADGMRVDAEAALANATTAPTFNLTLGSSSSTVTGAIAIKKLAGAAMSVGDIAGAGHRLMFEYKSSSNVWLLLNPAGIISRSIISVRNAIQAAKLDSNGRNSAIAAGTGLAVDLAATATALAIAFSANTDQSGNIDLVAVVAADQASAVSAIAASNTTYLHATWAGLSSVTWGKTLVPPQYGFTFARSECSLLNFEGGNGSTTFTDSFGNSWSPGGSAQISTAKFKFGASSGLLNGTTDYVRTTDFTQVGPDSWEMSVWFNINALPGAAARATLFNLAGGTFGAVWLNIFNNAGTSKLELTLSSNNTAGDIAAAVVGANTAWTLNQWNKARLVFDALAGTYKVYLSLAGAAETADISVSSSVRTHALNTELRLGATVAGASFFNGNLDAFRFLRCATNTTTETPSAVAPTVADQPVHYFSVPQMTMYEVTDVAPGAAQDPVMTQRYRCFVGEADTGAGAVSAVRNYAVRGLYENKSINASIPGAGVATSFNHLLGALRIHQVHELYVECLVAEGGYTVGDVTTLINATSASDETPIAATTGSRNTSQWTRGEGGSNGVIINKTTGARLLPTAANWRIGVRSRRVY